MVKIHQVYLVPGYYCFGPSVESSQVTVFQKGLCIDKIYKFQVLKKTTQKYDSCNWTVDFKD